MLNLIGFVALGATIYAQLHEGPTSAYVDNTGHRVEASPSRLKWFSGGIVVIVVLIQVLGL